MKLFKPLHIFIFLWRAALALYYSKSFFGGKIWPVYTSQKYLIKTNVMMTECVLKPINKLKRWSVCVSNMASPRSNKLDFIDLLSPKYEYTYIVQGGGGIWEFWWVAKIITGGGGVLVDGKMLDVVGGGWICWLGEK